MFDGGSSVLVVFFGLEKEAIVFRAGLRPGVAGRARVTGECMPSVSLDMIV